MPNRLLLRLAAQDDVRRVITSAPVTRAVVERFVAGETLEEALRVARGLNALGIGAILDYLGENVASDAQADAALAAYLDSLTAIGATAGAPARLDAHISVKLTQLGLDQSFEGALARMRRLCAAATAAGTRVAIDMEAHQYTDRTVAAYKLLREESDRLILCLQASLRRTQADVTLLDPARSQIRLCKGAYDEPGDIAYNRWDTMASYRRLLGTLLRASPYTAVATHDDLCVKEAQRIARRWRIPNNRLEFQMLYGVRRDLQAALVEQGHRVRVYVPFGSQWYPYLMRRMAERPANLRLFVESLLRG